MFVPRVKSLVEYNLSKLVKEFSLGGEKNTVKITIYPVSSPPGTYYIESRFLINVVLLLWPLGDFIVIKTKALILFVNKC